MSDNDFMRKANANKHLPVSLTLEHVSPVTRLLEKRKQMLQVQESLDSQKDEYSRKEELFKRREENLRKKDLELQESLVLFNKFLKENEQKRRRADHRANDEIKKRLKWEKQIQAHKASVALLRDKCERLKQAVAQNEKYHKYLEKVQDAYATHFDEISSIITRYQTLKSTNIEMIRLQESLLLQNETLRQEFNEYKKNTYNSTLSLNNDIASEAKTLEECVGRTSEVEESMISQEKEESDEQRISTQIILATDNLYHRCRRELQGIRRHGGPRGLSELRKQGLDPATLLKEETCYKLNEIKEYLEDFQGIIWNVEQDYAAAGETPPAPGDREREQREREHRNWQHQQANQRAGKQAHKKYPREGYDRGAAASSSSDFHSHSSSSQLEHSHSHNSSQVNRTALS